MKDTEGEGLTLNGYFHDRVALNKLAAEKLDTDLSTWEKDLYEFIFYWTDNTRKALEVITSGSTGTPKKILIRKEQMVNSAKMTLEYLGLKEGNTALLCLPAQYIAGKMMIVRAYTGGLNLLTLPPSSSPLKSIPADNRIHFSAMTPMQVHHTITDENTRELFREIDKVIVGGGAVSASLQNTLRGFPNRILETYGMTETVSHIAMREVSPKHSPHFQTLPGITIDTDEYSCLKISAPALNDEELQTNDIVKLYPPDRFIWKGRKDHIINSGGIKVHPESMEFRLTPLIARRFIVGSIPDEVLGQKVILILEGLPQKGSADSFLLQAIRESMDFTVFPDHIRYVSKFPETGSGKINRLKILEIIKTDSR